MQKTLPTVFKPEEVERVVLGAAEFCVIAVVRHF
jgi:hypothetical protein